MSGDVYSLKDQFAPPIRRLDSGSSHAASRRGLRADVACVLVVFCVPFRDRRWTDGGMAKRVVIQCIDPWRNAIMLFCLHMANAPLQQQCMLFCILFRQCAAPAKKTLEGLDQRRAGSGLKSAMLSHKTIFHITRRSSTSKKATGETTRIA